MYLLTPSNVDILGTEDKPAEFIHITTINRKIQKVVLLPKVICSLGISTNYKTVIKTLPDESSKC